MPRKTSQLLIIGGSVEKILPVFIRAFARAHAAQQRAKENQGFSPSPRQKAALKAAMGYLPTPKTKKKSPDLGVH